jgi:hypothetical protein
VAVLWAPADTNTPATSNAFQPNLSFIDIASLILPCAFGSFNTTGVPLVT